MMKVRLIDLALIGVLTSGQMLGQSGNCTHIEKSTRPDCPRALVFFLRLQEAVKKDDRAALASVTNYPLLTTLNHKQIQIHTRNQLLANFDQIFDAGVRWAILNATKEDVWGNWRGFTFDGGAVWFDGIMSPGKKPMSRRLIIGQNPHLKSSQ
jgi:hypothetical protein